MKYLILILLFSYSGFTFFGQSDDPIEITWDDLADIQYEEVYHDSLGAWFWSPIFGEKLYVLENKSILIEGYLSVIDSSRALLTDFSPNHHKRRRFDRRKTKDLKYIELPRIQIEYKSLNKKEPVTIEGILTLNSKDIYKVIFILEDSKIVLN